MRLYLSFSSNEGRRMKYSSLIRCNCDIVLENSPSSALFYLDHRLAYPFSVAHSPLSLREAWAATSKGYIRKRDGIGVLIRLWSPTWIRSCSTLQLRMEVHFPWRNSIPQVAVAAVLSLGLAHFVCRAVVVSVRDSCRAFVKRTMNYCFVAYCSWSVHGFG